MNLKERWRRARGRPPEELANLTDPEWVILELLMWLPREKLHAFIAATIKAARDPAPDSAAVEEMGRAMIEALFAGGKRRPDLLTHFGRVTLLLRGEATDPQPQGPRADGSDRRRARPRQGAPEGLRALPIA